MVGRLAFFIMFSHWGAPLHAGVRVDAANVADTSSGRAVGFYVISLVLVLFLYRIDSKYPTIHYYSTFFDLFFVAEGSRLDSL